MSGFVIGEVDASVHDKDGVGITSETDYSDDDFEKQRIHVDATLSREISESLDSIAMSMGSISCKLDRIIGLIEAIVSE